MTVSDEPRTSRLPAASTSSKQSLHAVPRHGLAEEDDVGLERPLPAGQAVDHHEPVEQLVGQLRVAVGIDLVDPRTERRVGRAQALVELRPAGDVAAVQADRPVQAAVQFDDVGRAAGLVQAVDVLRDDRAEQARRLQRRRPPGARRSAGRARICRQPT